MGDMVVTQQLMVPFCSGVTVCGSCIALIGGGLKALLAWCVGVGIELLKMAKSSSSSS